MPASPPPDPRPEIAQGVLLGAGMVGMADVLDAIAEAPVPLPGAAKAGLALAGGGLLAPIVLLVALPLVVFAGRRLSALAGDPPRWPGFWLGLGIGVPVLLALGVAFGAPPDWRHAAAGLLAPIAAGAIALAAPAGRARVFAVMLGLAPLVVVVEHGRRIVPTAGFPTPDAPHVVLVTVEGLRGGDWPAPAPRLPHLDAIAAEGVRFDRAFPPAPAVAPALGALLGGRAPGSVPDQQLGEALRAAGWQTAAFSGRASALAPHTPGFERALGGAPARAAIARSLLGRALQAADLGAPARRPDRTVVAEATAWLQKAATDPHRPGFAWVHLAGPAEPATPTPPWDTAYASGDPWDPGKPPLVDALDLSPEVAAAVGDRTDPGWLVGQHAGAISAADGALGALADALDGLPGDRPTVLAVAGTHGIALGDGGVWLRPESPPTPATARVALVLRAPGRLPRGTRSDEVVSLADLPPTLLELAGATPEDAPEGASLVPTAFGRRGRGWVGVRAADGAGATLFGRWWRWPHPGEGLVLREGAGDATDTPEDALQAAAAAVAAGRDPGPADPGLRQLAAP
jgi:arylsulfatase A-like enzyme